MTEATTARPSQAQLIFPLLDELGQRGGSAKATVVADALADRFTIPHDVRDQSDKVARGNVWRRHVRFARQKAAEMGYVRSSAPGVWALTPEGEQGIRKATQVVVVRVIVDPDGQPVGAQIELATAIPTIHTIHQGDSRDLGWIGDQEIPLIVTSVPYFDLIDYGSDTGQLAQIASYEAFVDALEDVMRECYRVLIPGGRFACNVGDVLRSRKKHGKHHVLPLHADIQVRARDLGFEMLTGILWEKIGNCAFEQGPGGVLGQPGQPNQIIQQGIEHVLIMRRPGPYRSPTPAQRSASHITREEHDRWFRPVWRDFGGARTKDHPAQFPVELPYRLIRMMSFVGDTVFDPFAGVSNTTKAAMRAGRHSVTSELSAGYVSRGVELAQNEAMRLAAIGVAA